jgi:hypothetical protein
MAFSTKLNLSCAKFEQTDGTPLTLSGDTKIASVGTICYTSDQSSTFTARSLADAAYVTGKTACVLGSAITGATNGLTKQAQQVKLGGILTGNTCVAIPADVALRYFMAGNGTCSTASGTKLYVGTSCAPAESSCNMVVAAANSCMGHSAVIVCAQLNNGVFSEFYNCNGCCRTTLLGTNALLYGNDYSTCFIARSIPDAAWVTGKTTTSGIQTANNGLTKQGTNVKLGGTLTGTTTIGLAGNSLCFEDTNACYKFTNNNLSLYACVSDGIDIAGHQISMSVCNSGLMYIDGTTDGIGLVSAGGALACVDGATNVVSLNAGTVSLTGGVKLFTTPTGGTTSDSVLVWNSTDKRVKCLSVATITGATAISANNGLTKAGNNIRLGGTLTGATTIDINTKQLNLIDGVGEALGIKMCPGNCSVVLSSKALPSGCLTSVSVSQDKIAVATECGLLFHGLEYTQPFCQYIAQTEQSIPDVSWVKYLITGGTGISLANNGLTKVGNRVVLGGALTGNTCITGAFVLGENVNQINISGATGGVNLGGSSVALKNLIGCANNLVCVNTSTGVLGTTSVTSLGGLTGATNGIGTTGQKVCLGGALVANTIIESDNGNRTLTLGRFCGLRLATSGETDLIIVGQSNGTVMFKSESGSGAIGNGTTNAIGILADFNGSSGFNIFDNRAGAAQTGIVYVSDYSLNYTNRSLVDKQYVDSIATGLNVHGAVRLATTGPITLSGNQTIDGVLTVTGDRILVKNQASGSTNGIYSASTSTWTRATDYDGTPSGEVSNGNLIPVTSGSTQNNTLWALTTLNPITVGVTSLTFSLFATNIDVQAGAGIAISMVGGVHTVCVNLGNGGSTGCGLSTAGTGLCVDPNLAGTALSYSAGVISICAANCGAVPAIPVGYNAGECLVVACSDLITATNAITGATNGLTRAAQQVKLGGTITGATTLTLSGVGSPTLVITDSRITQVGIQYTGNYCAGFTARSLVDAGYVTGKTTTSGIQTANNGLTKQGTNVKLGGALTGTTSITGAFTLNVCGGAQLNTQAGYQQSGSTILKIAGSTLSNANTWIGYAAGPASGGGTCNLAIGFSTLYYAQPTASGNIAIGRSVLALGSSLMTGCQNIGIGTQIMSCLSTGAFNIGIGCQALMGGAIVTTGSNNLGIGQNALANISSGNDNIAIGCAAGLNISAGCNNIILGKGAGAAVTAGSNQLYIGTGTNALIKGDFSTSGLTINGKLTLGVVPTAGATSDVLLVRNTGGEVRTLSVATLTGLTTITANNGLTKAGSIVSLGGALTGNTNITSTSSSLFIGDNSVTCRAFTSVDPNSYTVYSRVYKCNNDYSASLCLNAGTCKAEMIGKYVNAVTNITALSSCGEIKTTDGFTTNSIVVNPTNVIICGITCLATIPNAGTISDSVLVRNTSGEIKTVVGSSLGDKNNIYAKTTVAVSTTLTTGSTYVQLVNPTSGTTITLPATPINGQAFKIKDISGNALVNNITVNGGGHNIDGSATGLINTDFGALELMYDTASTAWYSLAFVN